MVEKRKPERTDFDIGDVVALENGLSIDENALDEAWIRHPDLFYRVARELVMAISKRDQAKINKEEAEARADARIRHDAEVSDEKVTESAVKSKKQLDPKVQAAENELAVLSERVGLLSALKESYIQRSYALKSLVELHTTGYFGTNLSEPANVKRMKQSDAESNREHMNRMRRR